MFHSTEKRSPQRRASAKRRTFGKRKTSGLRSQRSGAAVVEAAICFPLILVLMLGTLEITSGLYLRESLSICGFEACRVGTRRGATADDVRDRATEVLADRGVSGGEVIITPDSFDALNSLDQISVQVSAPTAGNSIFIFDNLANRTIRSRVTMIREFDD